MEWIATRQAASEIFVPGRDARARPIGRLDHPPFHRPPEEVARTAATAAALLAGPSSRPRPPARIPGGRETIPTGMRTATLEGAALAVMLDAPLAVATPDAFRDLVTVSAWSMNAPARPPDAPLARHLAIAERGATHFRPLAAIAFETLLARDPAAIEDSVRSRRRAARADGPSRFRLLAARSAGLRPLVLYIDLLPALAAAAEEACTWLRSLDRSRAEGLLGISIALFI